MDIEGPGDIPTNLNLDPNPNPNSYPAQWSEFRGFHFSKRRDKFTPKPDPTLTLVADIRSKLAARFSYPKPKYL